MRGVSSGDRISGELREVASKPRVLRLKQVLDACVLEHRPQILHEPWLRIYTEQISERVERRRHGSMVTMADGRNQISQLLDPKLVGAKLEMSGLMGGHDEKQALVFLRRRKMPQQCRQGDGLPIRADHGARGRFPRGIWTRCNSNLRAAETLHEEFDSAGNVFQGHTAQCVFDR